MLKEPTGDVIKKIVENDWLRKYVLKESRYCKYCEKESTCVLWSHKEVDYWYVLTCWECDGIQQRVYERQTMPFCQKCEESFKISGNDVLLKVYDETGERICENCVKDYLNKLQESIAE